MGTEPLEEEIPIEYEDLPDLVKLTFVVYEALRDEWDYMGGNYIGKNLSNLFNIFELYEVSKEEYLLVYKLISIIDSERRSILRAKNKV